MTQSSGLQWLACRCKKVEHHRFREKCKGACLGGEHGVHGANTAMVALQASVSPSVHEGVNCASCNSSPTQDPKQREKHVMNLRDQSRGVWWQMKAQVLSSEASGIFSHKLPWHGSGGPKSEGRHFRNTWTVSCCLVCH